MVEWMGMNSVTLSFTKNNGKQDGDLQSQARIRLSKDELRTDILSGDGR